MMNSQFLPFREGKNDPRGEQNTCMNATKISPEVILCLFPGY